jgi:hypothetical protein
MRWEMTCIDEMARGAHPGVGHPWHCKRQGSTNVVFVLLLATVLLATVLLATVWRQKRIGKSHYA